ncbi:molybdenum cofactor biosynthesis protein MoaE [Paenibacillus sp. FSL R7-0340]|jgi:molybdopterin synthase catalytic subunit|uniref:molybdenum cofactor biosynthesis protein MoaE n=1 Tax=unclassified Paenibacillus TaxID=185978 RepID=UPI001352DFEA|nr:MULTISPECIES: molybdenum cofactor biosynthesis protein MoaE [unclassified Paenibacillus]MBP1177446.1 molybdopterin synthase catalytic subunit [Paenibacillus sp. PvR133]MXO80593.1 molybdopterin converting factor [Paenibacillus sp. OT2-17]
MQYRIQLFAGMAEQLDDVITVELSQETVTMADIRKRLNELYPEVTSQLPGSFFTHHKKLASPDELVLPSDAIALHQSAPGMETVVSKCGLFAITYDPIDADEVTSKVLDPSHGASLTFNGTTREFTQGQRTVLLEYEAYVPMAMNTMKQIGDEIAEHWPSTRTAITHRLGTVRIGETSVVIAVSAAHRDTCYEASRHAIERLKQIVPIWKKEVWEDGSEWKGHQLGGWNPQNTPKLSNKDEDI